MKRPPGRSSLYTAKTCKKIKFTWVNEEYIHMEMFGSDGKRLSIS